MYMSLLSCLVTLLFTFSVNILFDLVSQTLTPLEADSSRPPFLINNQPYYAIGDQPPPTYSEVVQEPVVTSPSTSVPPSAFSPHSSTSGRHTRTRMSSYASQSSAVQGRADIGAFALQDAGVRLPVSSACSSSVRNNPHSCLNIDADSSKDSEHKDADPPTYAQSQAATLGASNRGFIGDYGATGLDNNSILESSV